MKLTTKEKALRKKMRQKKKITVITELKALDERLQYLLDKD